MIFKRGIKANLITLRERKTRYMVAIKNENKTANGTALAIISTLKNLKSNIKTITVDQGSEFNKYQWIKECLGAEFYFCEPASPHQKGAIENGNGVIRVELPRDCDFNALKQRQINALIDEINNRPHVSIMPAHRKRLKALWDNGVHPKTQRIIAYFGGMPWKYMGLIRSCRGLISITLIIKICYIGAKRRL